MDGQIDRRTLPHSLEHRANISLGLKRSAWSRRQARLAAVGKPHAPVPMDRSVVDAYIAHPVARIKRPPAVGECHWCYFYGCTIEHNQVDPCPA